MRAPRIRYILLFAVCSFLVAVIVTTFFAEFSKIHLLGAKLDEKMTELEKLERKNQDLKREIENAKSRDSIEREAREKYNLIKPGEKIYKIEVQNEEKNGE